MPADQPTLAAVVRERTGVAWSRARKLVAEGRVTVDGERRLDPAMRVSPEAVVVVNEHAPKVEKGPLQRSAIVFHDREVVVVEKPAGMLSVADEPGNKDTLVDHTRTLLRRIDKDGADVPLGVVHRLDRDTSGLMMFTRSPLAKRVLTEAFTAHDIERIYHAIAHGEVPEARMETHFLLDRGDGLRGSHGHFRRAKGEPPPDSRLAITFVKPIAPLAGATLVECRLETGRQHQIRIHLSEAGTPLLGEPIYVRGSWLKGAKERARRPMLHAVELGFVHPGTRKELRFTAEPPPDFARLLATLESSD